VPDASAKRAAFRALHDSGCFVIPNPWDVGSARALAELGFRALATTSAGFGFSRALPDTPTALGVEPVLEHIGAIVRATDLPVNADFQAGYGVRPEDVAVNVQRCAETGVAGLSIEDTTGASERPLYELGEAVARVRAAREALDSIGPEVLLTARAECFLVGHDDPLGESVKRLLAYAQAGADVLFAPGVARTQDIRTLVEAVAPKPLNVLISADIGLSAPDLGELGVRRVSVGSALARVAWGAFLRAARAIADEGSFGGLDGAASFAELNLMFERRPPAAP
jgi:2-methylisocitrate lyase-like PEP mutase family enzyme